MISRLLTSSLLAVTLTAGLAACGKKDEDKPAASAKQTSGSTEPAEAPAAPPARASQADCEKVVAKQLELETDPSIKSSMNMVKDTMIEQCTKEMTPAQAQCAAAAASGGAFADCLLQR